jgi:hypothetical protein
MRNLIFAIVLGICGIWLTIYGIEHPLMSMRAAGWPTAEGQIISSSVETFRSRRNTSYAPKVSYSYKVGATLYSSDVVEFSLENSGDVGSVREVVNRFPAGSKVTVHYAPADPQTACLIAGAISWRDFIPILIGLALTGVGVAAGLEWRRERKKGAGKGQPQKKSQKER